jgi:ribosomal protein S18 acetylase RimI-like enzyme
VTDSRNNIQPLAPGHAAAVAELHRSGISTGFLSSLGDKFLTRMYRAIARVRGAFGYVWQTGEGEVLGFIACSESTGAVYKRALVRGGLGMALSIAGHLLRPSVIKRLFQTLRYPSQSPADLPAAEVLSIAVSDRTRGQGVGKALMDAALAEFARRGVSRVRVAVWAGNETANRFYQRCGFTLAHTRPHHGLDMNIYVIDVPHA